MYDNVRIDLLVVLNLVAPEPENTDSQNVPQYSNRSPVLVTLNPKPCRNEPQTSDHDLKMNDRIFE